MTFIRKFVYMWLTILSCYNLIRVPYGDWEGSWFEHCVMLAGLLSREGAHDSNFNDSNICTIFHQFIFFYIFSLTFHQFSIFFALFIIVVKSLWLKGSFICFESASFLKQAILFKFRIASRSRIFFCCSILIFHQ